MSTNKILLVKDNNVIGHSTDTVFGLIAKFDKANIPKLNLLKGRDSDQPAQVLISSIDVIKEHIIMNDWLEDYLTNKLEKRTSYIVKVKKEFSEKYLLDSYEDTVLFRIPEGEIVELLDEFKMLFATSANKTGEEPIRTVEEFKNVFPNVEAFGEQTTNTQSRIISLIENKEEIIRK